MTDSHPTLPNAPAPSGERPVPDASAAIEVADNALADLGQGDAAPIEASDYGLTEHVEGLVADGDESSASIVSEVESVAHALAIPREALVSAVGELQAGATRGAFSDFEAFAKAAHQVGRRVGLNAEQVDSVLGAVEAAHEREEEIASLRADPDLSRALFDNAHPRNAQACETWRRAFGGDEPHGR